MSSIRTCNEQVASSSSPLRRVRCIPPSLFRPPPPSPRPRGVTLAAEKFDEGKKEGEKKSKSCVASIRTPLRHFDNAFVTRCFLLFLEISSISSSSIREITQFLALERKKKKRKETRFQRSGFETKEI